MIGFIGLSHLGINSSVAVASKGFATLGHDGDASLCSQLNEGQFPIFEPGLKELFELSRKNIEFTSRPDSLAKCKLVYFSFDVPTNSKNESDISTVREMIEQSISHLLPGTVFVILSQVPPGFCRSLLPLTEANGITLCYQVETLVFGSAVQRATKPERYIVGLQYPQKPLPAIFHELLKAFDCPISTYEI
ncbi:MAG: hypothetical protein IPK68_19755 [Bdellovibrionales bacterium]|nr:hypothetical protein [Bdellovibrionales bacterium]